jgi:hypothetical protein
MNSIMNKEIREMSKLWISSCTLMYEFHSVFMYITGVL